MYGVCVCELIQSWVHGPNESNQTHQVEASTTIMTFHKILTTMARWELLHTRHQHVQTCDHWPKTITAHTLAIQHARAYWEAGWVDYRGKTAARHKYERLLEFLEFVFGPFIQIFVLFCFFSELRVKKWPQMATLYVNVIAACAAFSSCSPGKKQNQKDERIELPTKLKRAVVSKNTFEIK